MAKPCCGTFWSNNFSFCPTCGQSLVEKSTINNIIDNIVSQFDFASIEKIIDILDIKWFSTQENKRFKPERKDLQSELTRLILDSYSIASSKPNLGSIIIKKSCGFEIECQVINNSIEICGRFCPIYFSETFNFDGCSTDF